MIKPFTIFVSIVVVIAAALFFPQILDAVRGMSVVEMMQQAVGFVLHVIVVSFLAYAAYALVEIVHPLLKTFQQKQRRHRLAILRGRVAPKQQAQTAYPRTRKDQGVLWLLSQLAQQKQTQQPPSQPGPEPRDSIHLDF